MDYHIDLPQCNVCHGKPCSAQSMDNYTNMIMCCLNQCQLNVRGSPVTYSQKLPVRSYIES